MSDLSRPFQFSIRKMLAVLSLFCAALAGGECLTRGSRSCAYIEKRGGHVSWEPDLFPIYMEVTWGSAGVTNEELNHVVRLNPQYCVSLAGNPKITDEGLDLLVLPRLQIIHVEETGVTDDGITRFKARHPSCAVNPKYYFGKP
jgi:hypothetical protein